LKPFDLGIFAGAGDRGSIFLLRRIEGGLMSPIQKKAKKPSQSKKISKAVPKKTAVKTKAKSPLPAKAALKPKALKFQPEINIYPNVSLLFEETAPLVMMAAREAADKRGRFLWALSGGSTPKGLFRQLTEEPYLNLMPWAKTYVFWVDERQVPLTHADSNYKLAMDHLLSKVPIPKSNIFPLTDGTKPVDAAASVYENKLKKFFGMDKEPPRFDLTLMGMGEDGHTASLFPGVQYLNEQKHWVIGYKVDDQRKERITLTFPVLNASRLIMVLVEGEKKAVRIKEVLEGPSDPPRYPIQYLRPFDGKVQFALDASAASLLKNKIS